MLFQTVLFRLQSSCKASIYCNNIALNNFSNCRNLHTFENHDPIWELYHNIRKVKHLGIIFCVDVWGVLGVSGAINWAPMTAERSYSIHTEKYCLNLVKSNQIWIVIKLFRLICAPSGIQFAAPNQSDMDDLKNNNRRSKE